ncbi:alpha/beta fold hydrolase [Microbulbifer thermotolerans]|uniref:Alpha/beta fold hydrolase n=1 Tax=Microbulbifer thermotolerans TaxID=252514 RepID=A0AB35HXN1_MICTH|nr:alpha/beta fold hydrolase [Microbulbifer thermotolerans]MCX2801198.1 alpha/beta fold hydrolase [Microbulbifer thermotolerans]
MKVSPLLALLCGALLAAHSWAAPRFISNLDIISFDGTELDANLFVPDTPPPDGGYPTVLFTNSWALDKHQYLLQAKALAEKGYLVMSYSTRGFGKSGGLVDVAGGNTLADTRVLIDWLEANYPVGKLGMAGISYGAGISLLTAAADSRVDAVAALSGWSDVVEGLYPNNTVNLVWGTLLVNTAFKREPIVDQIWSNLRNGHNLSDVFTFSASRSALSYVDALNANGTAVLLSNNFADYLFKPNSTIDLYTLLEGPKKLLLNPGTHAVTETLGGNGGHIWTTSFRWFDRYLKGENNGIDREPKVDMTVRISNRLEQFDDFPVTGKQSHWYLHPRLTYFGNGQLKSNPYSGWRWSNQFHGGADTAAGTGIPLVSDALEGLGIPVYTFMPAINGYYAIEYQSPLLWNGMKIRGTPTLEMWITPSKPEVQLHLHLYDTGPLGMGRLITHAPVTLRNAQVGREQKIDVEFFTTSYDVPAGHRVTLAIDTEGLIYQKPADTDYEITVPYRSDRVSKLAIPQL